MRFYINTEYEANHINELNRGIENGDITVELDHFIDPYWSIGCNEIDHRRSIEIRLIDSNTGIEMYKNCYTDDSTSWPFEIIDTINRKHAKVKFNADPFAFGTGRNYKSGQASFSYKEKMSLDDLKKLDNNKSPYKRHQDTHFQLCVEDIKHWMAQYTKTNKDKHVVFGIKKYNVYLSAYCPFNEFIIYNKHTDKFYTFMAGIFLPPPYNPFMADNNPLRELDYQFFNSVEVIDVIPYELVPSTAPAYIHSITDVREYQIPIWFEDDFAEIAKIRLGNNDANSNYPAFHILSRRKTHEGKYEYKVSLLNNSSTSFPIDNELDENEMLNWVSYNSANQQPTVPRIDISVIMSSLVDKDYAQPKTSNITCSLFTNTNVFEICGKIYFIYALFNKIKVLSISDPKYYEPTIVSDAKTMKELFMKDPEYFQLIECKINKIIENEEEKEKDESNGGN